MLKITSPSHCKCLETAWPLQHSETLKWFNRHKKFRADKTTSNLILLLDVNWLLLKLYLLAYMY